MTSQKMPYAEVYRIIKPVTDWYTFEAHKLEGIRIAANTPLEVAEECAAFSADSMDAGGKMDPHLGFRLLDSDGTYLCSGVAATKKQLHWYVHI